MDSYEPPTIVSRDRDGLAGRIPRATIERAMQRATGARRTDGNLIRLQFEGPLTFEAWLEAIAGAERYVHFENYVFRDDVVGRRFRDALADKARQGVQVRVLYDWMGCWATSRKYWKPLRESGAEVRAFSSPSITDPLGVFQRDHRKLVCVDGRIAFLGGFCIGQEWAGTDEHPPWRDTGVEVIGPAAAVAAGAFEHIWASMGPPVPEEIRADPSASPKAGDSTAWVIEGVPWRSRVYRALQLVAANARDRLWMTDPYFLTPRPMMEALAAAARDGVDVRVLVPSNNNWPWVGSLSRGGYRGLMENGVRIFEFQGPMIHAKTSVSDGLWCRIGSSNLNAASLLGNWEIDIGIFDRECASALEALFLGDLASSVEIVLPERLHTGIGPGQLQSEPELPRSSLDPEGRLRNRLERMLSESTHRPVRVRVADLLRAGSTFGQALAGRRPLGREDRTVLGTVSAALIVCAVLVAVAPRIAGYGLALLLAWFGVITGVRAGAQARRARRREQIAKAEREAVTEREATTSPPADGERNVDAPRAIEGDRGTEPDGEPETDGESGPP